MHRAVSLRTQRRVVIHILLRGLPSSSKGERSIEGQTVLIVGPAAPAHWPNVGLEEDDLEGVVWTTDGAMTSTIAALRESSCVVCAIGGDA